MKKLIAYTIVLGLLSGQSFIYGQDIGALNDKLAAPGASDTVIAGLERDLAGPKNSPKLISRGDFLNGLMATVILGMITAENTIYGLGTPRKPPQKPFQPGPVKDSKTQELPRAEQEISDEIPPLEKSLITGEAQKLPPKIIKAQWQVANQIVKTLNIRFGEKRTDEWLSWFNLLFYTAHIESDFRTQFQENNGPARTYFQLEPASVMDLLVRVSNDKKYTGLIDQFGLNISWSKVKEIRKSFEDKLKNDKSFRNSPSQRNQFMKDAAKELYLEKIIFKASALFAFLIYETRTVTMRIGGLSANVGIRVRTGTFINYRSKLIKEVLSDEECAYIWKTIFNTPTGKGSIPKAMKKIHTLKSNNSILKSI